MDAVGSNRAEIEMVTPISAISGLYFFPVLFFLDDSLEFDHPFMDILIAGERILVTIIKVKPFIPNSIFFVHGV